VVRPVVAAVADVGAGVVCAVPCADVTDGIVGSVPRERDDGNGGREREENAGRCCELVKIHRVPPAVS
jgi:hypothetical protein